MTKSLVEDKEKGPRYVTGPWTSIHLLFRVTLWIGLSLKWEMTQVNILVPFCIYRYRFYKEMKLVSLRNRLVREVTRGWKGSRLPNISFLNKNPRGLFYKFHNPNFLSRRSTNIKPMSRRILLHKIFNTLEFSSG